MPGENKANQNSEIHFDSKNGIADLKDRDWFPDLTDINVRLVNAHGFEHTDRHFDYLVEATFIIQGFSNIRIDGHFVTVPSDLTPFKEAADKFQKVMQKIDDLSEAIFDIRTDATSDTLLTHFDPERQTRQLMAEFGKTMGILAQIEQFEGQVGNRPVPDWLKTFCIHSQRFWLAEKGGGTRIIFEQTRQTKITPWLEDVFLSLTESLNVDVPLSRLKGVARNVPAYRPS